MKTDDIACFIEEVIPRFVCFLLYSISSSNTINTLVPSAPN